MTPSQASTAAERTLTEVVNGRTGRVWASGHLTSQGADLLRGTVEGLRRQGHSTVVVDLADVRTADDVGLHVLSDLCASMADRGDRLLVGTHRPRRPPAPDGSPTRVGPLQGPTADGLSGAGLRGAPSRPVTPGGSPRPSTAAPPANSSTSPFQKLCRTAMVGESLAGHGVEVGGSSPERLRR